MNGIFGSALNSRTQSRAVAREGICQTRPSWTGAATTVGHEQTRLVGEIQQLVHPLDPVQAVLGVLGIIQYVEQIVATARVREEDVLLVS